MSAWNMAQVCFEIWGCVISLVICLLTAAEVTQDKSGSCLWKMLLANILVLVSDCLSYVYRGDMSSVGYIMTRVCNFSLYVGEYGLTLLFAKYVRCVLCEKFPKEKNNKKWLHAVCIIIGAAFAMLVINSFTGIYYHFDSTNHYQRGKGIIISFAANFLSIFIAGVQLAKHRKQFDRTNTKVIVTAVVLLIFAMAIQIISYGISLINITLTISIIICYLKHYFDRIKALTSAEIDQSKAETTLAMKKYIEMQKKVEELESQLEKNEVKRL